MAIKTPPLHAKGLYTVTTPYELQANTLYECAAIRDFQDLIQQGVDIFTTYYAPVNLTPEDYAADLAAGANIVTLLADTAPAVRLPDSYIAAYPDMGGVVYNQVVLSLSMGPLPDYLDLTFVKQQLAAVASDTLGLTPAVNVFIAPSTGSVTQAEADAHEVARQAAITNRTTDRAKVVQLQTQLAAAQAQNAALIELLQQRPPTS
jgi:hypothetical protein